MGIARTAAIAAAERIERIGGPRAGLTVWRTVASNAVDASVRATALLAAMRCAVTVRDRRELVPIAREWERVEAGIHDEVFEWIRGAAALGFVREATTLARAEASRHRSARGLLALGRLLVASGDAGARAVLADAITRAEGEGHAALAASARLHLAELLDGTRGAGRDALEEAKRVDPAAIRPEDRVTLARILLRSESRFVRAGAIDLLDPLVSGADAELADRALELLATFADDAGDTLTPMESDRLRALFGRPPVAARAARARQALEVASAFARAREGDDAARAHAMDLAARFDPEFAALHARARALTRGEAHVAAPFELAVSPASADEAQKTAWSAVLELAFALRDDAPARAAHITRALHARATRSTFPVPAAVWTPLVTALGHDDPELHAIALALAEVLLASPARRAPPRGWSGVAVAFALAGRDDLAQRALRAAVACGEPGGKTALGSALLRAAWRASEEGDRARALALLREARTLASPRD